MADDSGRVVWLWGPLLLVAALVAVFRFAETGGADSATGEPRGAASSALRAGTSPGAAVASPMRGGEVWPAGDGFTRHPGHPAVPYATGPAPYPGAPGCPPWTGYAWPQSFPRPGDHPGRYWGGGAPEWGPPIGAYGPDTQVDPYWWVAVKEADR